MKGLTSRQSIDEYFLEARCKLLDVAAILDRITRGGDASALESDPRMQRIHQAIALLNEGGEDLAERLQQVFSLPYDPDWVRPQPRSA